MKELTENTGLRFFELVSQYAHRFWLEAPQHIKPYQMVVKLVCHGALLKIFTLSSISFRFDNITAGIWRNIMVHVFCTYFIIIHNFVHNLISTNGIVVIDNQIVLNYIKEVKQKQGLCKMARIVLSTQ